MLGWILAGMVLGAAVITIAYLSVESAKAKTKEKFSEAVSARVKTVIKNNNIKVVKMDALDECDNTIGEIEFNADEISSDIYEGKRIYI